MTLRVIFIFCLLYTSTSAQSDPPTTPQDWVQFTVKTLCAQKPVLGLSAQQQLPGVWFLGEEKRKFGRNASRLTQRFTLPTGDELRIIYNQVGTRLQRFTVELYKQSNNQLYPFIQVMADTTCQLRSARRIIQKKDKGIKHLELLENDLKTVRWQETLEAPWPQGQDPGGPRVALVDSGLAYDLPLYRNRLARNSAGEPLGYDFWDLDPWPYDGDISRSPFLPIRHGSAVASILVREAPSAALIPFRYPRPNMNRMEELVNQAVKAGARILAISLGSRKLDDWISFERAMRAHPELLAIVSAGNDGRNLDKTPLWPAALELDNLIVVTSADEFGRLAEGSNWGPKSVDIMLPAENIQVVNFRGATGLTSGSSYAVPRLAALAARLLTSNPKLTTQMLKAQIFARAVPSPYEDKVVTIGWIPDPLRDKND